AKLTAFSLEVVDDVARPDGGAAHGVPGTHQAGWGGVVDLAVGPGRRGIRSGIRSPWLPAHIVARFPDGLAGVRIEAEEILPANGLILRVDLAAADDEHRVPLTQLVRPQLRRTRFRPGAGQVRLFGNPVEVRAAQVRPLAGD